MFRGSHEAKIDDKGRLKVPSAFKALMDAANVTQFFVTSTNGKWAEIWPLPEWERWSSVWRKSAPSTMRWKDVPDRGELLRPASGKWTTRAGFSLLQALRTKAALDGGSQGDGTDAISCRSQPRSAGKGSATPAACPRNASNGFRDISPRSNEVLKGLRRQFAFGGNENPSGGAHDESRQTPCTCSFTRCD